jgi:hypothetical protein
VKTSPYCIQVNSGRYKVMEHLYLLLAGEEEFKRINPIGNSAADERYPVENKRWLIRVLEQQLIENVQRDDKGDEGGRCKENELPDG